MRVVVAEIERVRVRRPSRATAPDGETKRRLSTVGWPEQDAPVKLRAFIPRSSTSAMKQLPRLAPLLALLAVAATTVVTLRWRAARHAWQPLPGGGEVRVLAVTHGMQHSVDIRRASWRDRVRDAWRARSLRPLTRSALPPQTIPTGGPSIALWLEARHLPASGLQSGGRAELVLPDGQTFRTGQSSWGGGAAQGWHYTVIFPIIPTRAKTLHWNVKLNGALLGFDAPNPTYRTDLPAWKAEPLPQTRQHDDLALTLHAVNLEPSADPDPPADWEAKPVWTITRAGNPAEGVYNVGAIFGAPTGNLSSDVGLFSDPVWKVRAQISRTDHFPFTEEEVCWLATIDPAIPEARTPQAYALLPLVPGRAPAAWKLIGVFGSGEFEIKEAAVTSTGPAQPVEAHRQIDWDNARGVHIVRLDRPAFIILEGNAGPTRPILDVRLFRDEQGAVAQPNERSSSGSPGGSLRIYDLPAKPLRLGLAKSEPFTLEFFIPAPKRPPLKTPAPAR